MITFTIALDIIDTKINKFKKFKKFHHRKHINISASLRLTKSLKACVRYFLSKFYFSPNDSPSKTMKNAFYFISLCSRDIQIFVFPSFPLFLPLSHCFRG